MEQRNIYAGIDIGGDAIKIVVLEHVGDEFYNLASSKTPSEGLLRGLINNSEEGRVNLKERLKSALNSINKELGFPLTKAIITIPANESDFFIVDGGDDILGIDQIVTDDDIKRLHKNCLSGKISLAEQLVFFKPLSYKLDNKLVQDPIGMIGNRLFFKGLVATVPKEHLYPFFNLFDQLGIEVVGMNFSLVGDFLTDTEHDNYLTGIINIGKDIIELGLFNKGILFQSDYIKLGSQNIDKDISLAYNVHSKEARELKEKFGLALRRKAEIDEERIVETIDGGTVSVKQLDLSRLIELRLTELLRLSEEKLKKMTNKKINKIIVTGGVTNLKYFSDLVNQIYIKGVKVIEIKILGLRDNSYSSIIGVVKDFALKMEKADRNYSMFNQEEINMLINKEF